MTALYVQVAEQVAELYHQGRTHQEIADELHIGPTTVHRALHHRRVRIRTCGRNSESMDVHYRTVELYRQGLSTNQIAAVEGVTQRAVWNRLRRAGVTLRSKSEGRALRAQGVAA